MNKREIFEITARHLFQQGKQSIGMIRGEQRCRYRGPKGLKCAAGIHITDEEYKTSLEGRSAYALFEVLPTFREKYAGKRIDMLSDLQQVHDRLDNWESSETMRLELQKVALMYKIPHVKFLSSLSFADR